MRIATLAAALLLAAAASGPVMAWAEEAPTSAPNAAPVASTPESGVKVGAITPGKPKDVAKPPDAAASSTRAASAATKLYAPASQLINWPMQVTVSPDLPEGAEPRLTLLLSHGHATEEVTACADIPVQFMSRNQSWVGGADTDGANTQHVGTLLLFDLSAKARCTIDPTKAMVRVRPLLDWTPPGKACTDCRLIGTGFVSLGNATVAFVEALLAVLLGVLVIVGIARIGNKHRLIELFYSVDDGKLSLSMLQMAIWTLAATLMVIFEDLLRLDTPTVPSSIVVLMGMSLLTTGFSYHLTANPPSGVAPPARAAVPSASLSDLLSIPDSSGVMKLSLSRAQMLLWTLVMVVLFIAKSAVNQDLWDIPWPLVALMGVSQAGYLGGKFSQ